MKLYIFLEVPTQDYLCWLCPGNRSIRGLEWNDFRPGVLWQELVYNPAHIHENPASTHPVFGLPGVTELNVMHDVLHVCDTHGLASYFCGSAIFTMIYMQMDGSAASNMGVLWEYVQKHYDELGTTCRYSNFKLSMICDANAPHRNYPQLHGKKAPNVVIFCR